MTIKEILSELLGDYFVCFMSCLIFGFFLIKNRVLSKANNERFFMATGAILLLCISQVLDTLFSTFTTFFIGRSVTTAFGYILRVGIIYEIVQISNRSWKKKWRKLNIIPLILNALICIASIWTEWVFYFTEENVFHGGPLHIIPFIIPGFYLTELVVNSFLYFKHREWEEFFVCWSYALATVLAVIFEDAFGGVTRLIPMSSIVGLILLFLCYTMNRYMHDQLTKVYLRTKFFSDAENINENTCVLSIDINGLGLINETRGHAAGDEALSSFTEAVFSCLPEKADFYRIGGDEFAILYRTSNEKQVQNLIWDIRQETKDSNLTFSIGYAFFKDSTEFEAAFELADYQMMNDKRENYFKHID